MKQEYTEFLIYLKKARERIELEDGYAFLYPRNRIWAARLERFEAYYRRHYPFFSTDLAFESNPRQIKFQLRGPEGAKEFIEYTLGRDIKKKSHFRTAIRIAPRFLTSPIRILPDFLIIGAAKSSTNSLYYCLAEHPCVAPAFRKETYFFDRTYGRGLAWYRSFFPTVLERDRFKRRIGTRFVTGEATPCYLFHPHAPKRVFETVPNARLIVSLRNPVDRAYSDYHMQLSRGIEALSFEEAIEREEFRLQGELGRMVEDETYFSFNRQNYGYLSRGVYADQLSNWTRFFPTAQILILQSEQLNKEPVKNLKRILKFLNLPDWTPSVFEKLNFVPYPKMADRTRESLLEYFRPHNQRLYELTGVRFDWHR